jgi:hypothetical protein
MAALSTEYDLLQKQAADLKTFIKQNEGLVATHLSKDKSKDSSALVALLQKEKKDLQ